MSGSGLPETERCMVVRVQECCVVLSQRSVLVPYMTRPLVGLGHDQMGRDPWAVVRRGHGQQTVHPEPGAES